MLPCHRNEEDDRNTQRKGIEIAPGGNYPVAVTVWGRQHSFHVNSRTFDSGNLNKLAGLVMERLRRHKDWFFFTNIIGKATGVTPTWSTTILNCGK